MLRFIRALHLIGVTMFLGSILCHVTTGFVPGAQDNAQTALVVRQTIDVATVYLTVPGLVLVVLTGTLMIVIGRLSIFRTRWLALHAIFGLLIMLNAAFVLYPLGQNLLSAALQTASGTLPLHQLHALEGREAAFGAANLLLCIGALLIATIKPRLRIPKA